MVFDNKIFDNLENFYFSTRKKVRNLDRLMVLFLAFLVSSIYILSFFGLTQGSKIFIFSVLVLSWSIVSILGLENYIKKLQKGSDIFKKKSENEYKSYKQNTPIKGDVIVVKSGETIPVYGKIVEGKALLDESKITKSKNPIFREEGLVFSGSTLISGWLVIKVLGENESDTAENIKLFDLFPEKNAGKNENVLTLFKNLLTLILTVSVCSLYFYVHFLIYQSGGSEKLPVIFFISFLLCLIPTTFWGLLSVAAKYFSFIPLLFSLLYPVVSPLNIMNISSLESAAIASLIYDILLMIFLIFFDKIMIKLRENLTKSNVLAFFIFLGVVVPFFVIKAVDIVISSTGIF